MRPAVCPTPSTTVLPQSACSVCGCRCPGRAGAFGVRLRGRGRRRVGARWDDRLARGEWRRYGRAGAFLPMDSARAIFADPAAFVVSGTAGGGRAVSVDGGYLVTGRWPFGSGASHATWFSPLCEVDDAGGGPGRGIFAYAPRSAVVLHDNWQVSGLCATASVDFECRDVFVSNSFVHPFQPEPTHPGVLYRLPTASIFPWTVAVVPLGLARGPSQNSCGWPCTGSGAVTPSPWRSANSSSRRSAGSRRVCAPPARVSGTP